MDSVFLLISRITVMTIILTVIIGFWQRRHFTKPIKVFFIYCVVVLALNFVEQTFIWLAINYYALLKPFLDKWEIENTNFLNILFYLNDLFFLSWFYFLLLPSNYGKWVKRIGGILFLTFIINYLSVEGYQGYGVFNPNANALFIFSVGLFYLGYLYRSELALPLKKNSYLWFSTALVVPNLTSFMLFLIGDVSQEEDYARFVVMSLMRNGFLLIGQILIIIGFLQARYAKYMLPPIEQRES